MSNIVGQKSNRSAMLLFLIGLFSQTQIHVMGSIGISEVPIFIFAPVVFLMDYKKLKHDGFLPFVWLVIAVCAGCVVSCICNSTPFILAIKGFATPYSIFAITVVFYHIMRENLSAIKWLFVGVFCSLILSVFVFQPETYTFTGRDVASGEEAVERMMSYPLFWAMRVSALIALPVKCMYLRTPLLYSVIMTLAAGLFSIMFSDSSGRATAMVSLFAAVLLCLGGKSQKKLVRLGRRFPMVIMVMLLVGLVGKVGYSVAAKNGLLGEKATEKYLRQTSQGDSILKILMAGRKEFFVGMRAAIDKPIFGHGPKAEDTKGYFLEYISEYGDYEEYEYFWRQQLANAEMGFRYFIIPTHSFMASFWVYYGIFGLIFWINALWMIWKYYRTYSAAIPQWFGYLAVFLPTMVWGTFFAPFGDRIGCTLPLVCILFVKAVYEKRIMLPRIMQMEIAKYNQ